MSARDWFRPPRHLLLLFFGITAVSVVTLGWLSWQVARQDRALSAQRAQEQRENVAGLAVAALQKRLSEVKERLSVFTSLPDEYSRNLPADSILLVFGPTELKAYPSGRLLYYPATMPDSQPPGDVFIKADALEFQQKDYARAVTALEAISRTSNIQIRADGLVRMARNLRKAGRWEQAITVYAQLSRMAGVDVNGIPADLLAQTALCDVLEEHNVRERLQHEASILYKDLHGGRWRLSRALYDVYTEQARRILGSEAAPFPHPGTLGIADAAQLLWQEWQTRNSVSPRQTFWVADRSILAMAHTSAGRTAVLLAGPDYLRSWLTDVQELAQSQNAQIAISDSEGHAVAGPVPAPEGSYSLRLSSATGLPWTIYAISLNSAADANAFSFRSRLVNVGLFAIALLVVGGSYLIGRAVSRELAVARLQSDFVTAVSHEFRTPLTALRQLSELLAKGRVPNDGVRLQYYEVLEHESARLQRLVEGLLKFGRMEAGAMRYQFETIDTIELLRSLVEEFRSEADRRGCCVEFSAEHNVPAIRADREALSCVVWNLLDNALKYSPDCRTVWVDLTVERERGHVAIRVRDEGVGIAREDHQRIFEKFVRGKVANALGVQGAGIGLAVAHQIVVTHGGEIQLQSELERGSTFTVLLPAIES